MAVGAGVGLGDRERHLLAADDRRQELGALRVGAEPADHLGADRGGHEDQEQRASLRRDLLAHDRELGHAAAATAVGLGEVHREEALVGERLPQLVGLRAGAVALGEVLVAELPGDVGDGLAQHDVLG